MHSLYFLSNASLDCNENDPLLSPICPTLVFKIFLLPPFSAPFLAKMLKHLSTVTQLPTP